jgi:hypothetical protein
MKRAVSRCRSSEINCPGGGGAEFSALSCCFRFFSDFSTGLWISSVQATWLPRRCPQCRFLRGVDNQRWNDDLDHKTRFGSEPCVEGGDSGALCSDFVSRARGASPRRYRRTNGAWRSLVSALVWGTRGPRFKSGRPDSNQPVAVAHKWPKRREGGSGCTLVIATVAALTATAAAATAARGHAQRHSLGLEPLPQWRDPFRGGEVRRHPSSSSGGCRRAPSREWCRTGYGSGSSLCCR